MNGSNVSPEQRPARPQTTQRSAPHARDALVVMLSVLGGACVIASVAAAALSVRTLDARLMLNATANATATAAASAAIATPAPTFTLAPTQPMVTDARLGGPISAFEAAYGNADGNAGGNAGGDSHGSYLATIAGQFVSLNIAATELGESEDGQPRAVVIDVTPASPLVTWSPSVAAAIARAFLPLDAHHTRDVASQFGLDHQYTSVRLAASVAPSAFLYPNSSPAPVGWLDWSCHVNSASGGVDTCEVAA